MTTPEAGRAEEIQARHEKDRAENPLFFYPAYPDAVYRDRSTLLAALTTQAETIRRLEERVTALVNADCAHDDLRETIRRLEHDIIAYRGSLGYSCPGDHNGFLIDGTLPVNGIAEAQYETIRRLEGVIADKYPAPPNHYLVALQNHLKGAEQRAEAAEETIRKQGQMIRDLTIAADAAEQRAEAAEGRVRELEEALRDMLAFGVEFDDEGLDYMSVQIPRAAVEQAKAALTPSPATGEGA